MATTSRYLQSRERTQLCGVHMKAKGHAFEGEDLYIGVAAIQQEVVAMASSWRQVKDHLRVNAPASSPNEQAIVALHCWARREENDAL